MKPAAMLLALIAIAPFSPALAQSAPIWGGHYNMGVFAAGGGSEKDGHISLSCSGENLADSGAFFLQLTPASRIEPFVNAPPQLDFSIDGKLLSLPVTAENGAVFFYRSDANDDRQTLALIDALRRGLALTVSAPELDIAEIPLRGSFEALTYVNECVAENN